MSQDFLAANRQLIETYFYRVWNQGELDLLDHLLDDQYLNHSAGRAGTPPPGPEGLKPIITAMRKGFPDLHYTIQDLVITEDRIVARVRLTGTLLGELWGMAPNGKKIEVNQINIEYVRNGRITEHWRLTDELAMMQQLQS
jgi:predicted ester cyclase